MPINLSMPETTELKPRIAVIGVGGAGGNAINNMVASELEGVEFIVANTDAQALAQSRAERRVQLGRRVTQGLGAGSHPDVGCAAAEESLDEIVEMLTGSHMVFVTAGMGGGTGTGAAPVIARAARELGLLTVGVVTKPFQFEGARRLRVAEEGIRQLSQYVDTLIIIPNQNLFRVANEKTTFAQAFAMADQVLHSGVRGITDLMVVPGLINLDFNDVRAVMSEMGKAMMGTGESSGDKRAVEAAEAAIANPLLEETSMQGARGVLINITGGPDMTLFEVEEAANRVKAEVDPDANIIFGSTTDERLEGKIRVSIVATGIDAAAAAEPKPEAKTPQLRAVAGGAQPAPPVRMAPPAAAAPAPALTAASADADPVLTLDETAALDADDAPVANPVHRQIAQLAESVPARREPRAEPAAPPAPARAPERLEPRVAAARPAAPAAPAPAEEKARKRGGSWLPWRSAQPDEPAAAQPRGPRPVEPRVTREPARPRAAAAPVRQADPAPELFGPDEAEGDLDIPTFLRRQSN